MVRKTIRPPLKNPWRCPCSVESQSLTQGACPVTSRRLVYCYAWCTYIDTAAWTNTHAVFNASRFFQRRFRRSGERMDNILYHLPHFASPKNDAIGSASKFQICTINEGYSIWRHEPDFRPKTKTYISPNRAGDSFLICIEWYIIWKPVFCYVCWQIIVFQFSSVPSQKP